MELIQLYCSNTVTQVCRISANIHAKNQTKYYYFICECTENYAFHVLECNVPLISVPSGA